MPCTTVKEFYSILNKSDTKSMYEAAKFFAKSHQKYLKGNNHITVSVTEQTLMGDMMAKTQDTPQEKLEEMRSKREKAREAYCYIYGGYIAYKLQQACSKDEYRNIKIKDEYIALATEQLLEAIFRNLEKNGYKKGTFSHLVHMAVKRKSIDLKAKLDTQLRNAPHKQSFDNIKDILGGVIDIDDQVYEQTYFDEDIEDKEFNASVLLAFIIRELGEQDPNTYEMFVQRYVYKKELKDIANEFEKSESTISRRVNAFSKQAVELYKKRIKEMEDCW